MRVSGPAAGHELLKSKRFDIPWMELILVDQHDRAALEGIAWCPGIPVVPQPVITLRVQARPRDDGASAVGVGSEEDVTPARISLTG